MKNDKFANNTFCIGGHAKNVNPMGLIFRYNDSRYVSSL